MITVGVVAMLYWRRRSQAPWGDFWLGALAWCVSVALKFVWAAPTNRFIHRWLEQSLPGWLASPLFELYVGLLTGIFECGFTLLIVRKTRLRSAGWNSAIAFGVGFGAIEAIMVGLLNFVGTLASILYWEQLAEAERTTVAAQTAMGVPAILLPAVERFVTLVIHVFSCILIAYGVRARQEVWFWMSFTYKSAVDAFAAWSIVSSQLTKSLTGLIILEMVVAAFAALGLMGLASMRRRFEALDAPECVVPAAVARPTTPTA